MQNKNIENKTGVAIPVSALKSENNCGCGEFLDLIHFASFCKKSGLSVIQILPVNDTGTESSPYSALSAFALHPIYLNLSELSEVKDSFELQDKIKELHDTYYNYKRFPYKELRNSKESLLKLIFSENQDSIMKDENIDKWISKNPWIISYSVFKVLKNKNLEASWKEWKTNKKITKEKIQELWQEKFTLAEHRYFAWVQMNLDIQFQKAVKEIRKMGILLKGDIPIMMNEDSCDAWANPEYFIENMRAGSPPDNMNPVGQNWGFPLYNWKNLKKENFSWWKERLVQASKFYDAYRLDHILGFFRIWAISERETTGYIGYTLPSVFITKKQLEEQGFTEERIRWLSKSHVPTRIIEEVNNNDYLGTHGQLQKIMDRIGNEEMWLFKDSIKGDKDIWESDLSGGIKKRLVETWKDKCLIEISKNNFVPLWCFNESTSWKSLNNDEKDKLNTLFTERNKKMESEWKKQATEILTELTSCTKMIPCAEDLGANPKCVPEVLEKLGILGLRVIRWNRLWAENGQPYQAFKDYPRLSVTTTSVHDSSTLRLWWQNEEEAGFFYNTFEHSSSIKQGYYNEETAKYILSTAATSNSYFCIHPIQDYLGLTEDYIEDDIQNERINIPGSVTNFNWTYKIPVTSEKLTENETLTSAIKEIVDIHKR